MLKEQSIGSSQTISKENSKESTLIVYLFIFAILHTIVLLTLTWLEVVIFLRKNENMKNRKNEQWEK